MPPGARTVDCWERFKAKFRREKSPAITALAGDAPCNSIPAQSRPERQGSSRTPTRIAISQPSSSTNPNDVDAAKAPHASAASDRAASPSRLPERLWNQAYEEARIEDPATVSGYELILSAQLSQEDADFLNVPQPNSTHDTAPKNLIERDAEKRKEQMDQLVKTGLQRIEKEDKMKQDIENGTRVAMVFKEVVDKAVEPSREAALAWVGVCIGVQVRTDVIETGFWR